MKERVILLSSLHLHSANRLSTADSTDRFATTSLNLLMKENATARTKIITKHSHFHIVRLVFCLLNFSFCIAHCRLLFVVFVCHMQAHFAFGAQNRKVFNSKIHIYTINKSSLLFNCVFHLPFSYRCSIFIPINKIQIAQVCTILS